MMWTAVSRDQLIIPEPLHSESSPPLYCIVSNSAVTVIARFQLEHVPNTEIHPRGGPCDPVQCAI
jgi:hypothetical protein